MGFPLKTEYIVRSLPKQGNQGIENEDAVWPMILEDSGQSLFRCAIADGATRAAFSREWADLLVRSYSSGNLQSPSEAELADLRAKWHKQFENITLPWYHEEMVFQGGFAALLGLSIWTSERHEQCTWQAIAVGDCCQFLVRQDNLIISFPITKVEQFTNRPFLISSVSNPQSPVDEHIKQEEGHWELGDTFYLMSDAIAEWFLNAVASDQKPWRQLNANMTNDDVFAEYIGMLRAESQLRNDDVTIIQLTIS